MGIQARVGVGVGEGSLARFTVPGDRRGSTRDDHPEQLAVKLGTNLRQIGVVAERDSSFEVT